MQIRKKTHKGRLSFVLSPLQTIWKGKYAGVALENARITESQLKAAELAIKRTIKKNGDL
jgi:ribosomal protein L16/L10AE